MVGRRRVSDWKAMKIRIVEFLLRSYVLQARRSHRHLVLKKEASGDADGG